MTAIFFAVACKELKIAQIDQINQLSQLLNLICAYGDTIYGLTRMLMSKNVNNDARKDSSIECFHSRGQHLCKYIGTKESVYIVYKNLYVRITVTEK